jgi:hypothetical protein
LSAAAIVCSEAPLVQLEDLLLDRTVVRGSHGPDKG